MFKSTEAVKRILPQGKGNIAEALEPFLKVLLLGRREILGGLSHLCGELSYFQTVGITCFFAQFADFEPLTHNVSGFLHQLSIV